MADERFASSPSYGGFVHWNRIGLPRPLFQVGCASDGSFSGKPCRQPMHLPARYKTRILEFIIHQLNIGIAVRQLMQSLKRTTK